MDKLEPCRVEWRIIMVWINDQHFNEKSPPGTFGGSMCPCNDCAIKRFNEDRDSALLSLDKNIIVAFYDKNKIPYSQKDDVFWASIHKAITAIPKLPIEFRKKSKKYLDEHGLSSLDDGDL